MSAVPYETVTVPAGTVQNIPVGLDNPDEVLEHVLYDVTAEGAGVTFRLFGRATIRNVGIKGSNQSDRHIFRVGGSSSGVALDRIYTEHFDANSPSVGGIICTANSAGTVTVRGASVHGFGNNGLYASKSDADLHVSDCYFTNNRTGNFRGGGDYHGNNREHIFDNCVCVIDDLTDVPLYPNGGNRTAGFIARWGTPEVHNCHMYLDPNAPDPVGTGTISDNSMCMRADSQTGDPTLFVFDSEVSPRDRIEGDVRYVQNVGSTPSQVKPDYAPATAEEAASGVTGGNGGGNGTNQPPTARFDYDPLNPIVGDSVSLDAGASSDPDGSIVSYEWVIDRPTESTGTRTGVTAEFQATEPGEHVITLTVTDDAGATATDTQSILVTEEAVNQPPVAQLAVSPSVPAVGDTVSLDASGSSDPDGSIASYSWEIETPDASLLFRMGERTTFVPETEGDYTIELTVEDDGGAIALAVQTITATVTGGGGGDLERLITYASLAFLALRLFGSR